MEHALLYFTLFTCGIRSTPFTPSHQSLSPSFPIFIDTYLCVYQVAGSWYLVLSLAPAYITKPRGRWVLRILGILSQSNPARPGHDSLHRS